MQPWRVRLLHLLLLLSIVIDLLRIFPMCIHLTFGLQPLMYTHTVHFDATKPPCCVSSRNQRINHRLFRPCRWTNYRISGWETIRRTIRHIVTHHWILSRRDISIGKETPLSRIFTHHCSLASTDQYSLGGIACTLDIGRVDSCLFPE